MILLNKNVKVLLKALKKVKYWLYRVRFVLKIDINVLVA